MPVSTKSAFSLPLAVVVWHDAWVKEEPILLDDAKTTHLPTTVTTIGWVLYEDEKGISLANEHYDASWRGRTFIPKAMIVSVTPFKLAKPRMKHEKAASDPAPVDTAS